MRLAIALLLLTAAPLAAAQAQATAANATAEDARFEEFGRRAIDRIFADNPVYATAIGEHRFDDRLPDVSAAGRARTRALAVDLLAELGRFDRGRLGRENQIDLILLADQLRYTLFSIDTLQDWAWDPLANSGTAGTALFGLVSREFAPLPDRLRSATGRLEALPGFLAGVRGALVPARVPRIHAETAAKQNPGLNGLIDGISAEASKLPAAEATRLTAAAAAARAAVAEHQRWLDTVLVPAARGNERLGARLYDTKLALALNSPLSRAEIKARAEATIAETRARMYVAAAELLRGRPGAPPTPARPSEAQLQTAIEAALAIATQDVTAPGDIVSFARQTMAEATAFAKARDLISFPTASFEVIDMPEYARGVAGAYADMPGPLEKDQRGFYAVSPIPPEWTPAQVASHLRENNKWGIHELTLHEAVPGHLLQLAHSNLYKGPLRAVLQSGPMVEGWAMYGETVMADAGYQDRNPRYLLAHYKYLLRATLNAILDQDFHTGGLDKAEAMRMMTKIAFQEEREADGKWTRMRLSSAQLPVYFVGFSEWRDLRAAAAKRPGFAQKSFHDLALSHGSPPVRFIRQMLFAEPIE